MRYSFEDIELDSEKRTVHRGSQAIALPDLSFDTLLKLFECAPAVVTYDDLCRDVWRADHVSAETIAQRIALLRKALKNPERDYDYIRTVRGTGYALTGPVTTLAEPTSRNTSAAIKTAALAAGILMMVGVGILLPRGAEPVLPATDETELSEKSTAAILVERARDQLSLHQSRETDRAIDLLRQALLEDPDSFDARSTLSAALSTKATKFGGDDAMKQEAETLARSLISEQPENSNAWSLLAYALGSQGRLDESSSAYEYAFQLDPGNAIAMSSAAHNLLIRGELQQAYVLEMRAKQAGGNNKYAEIQIAQIFELIGHSDMTKWQEQALALNPGQVVVLSELARSYLRQAKPGAALDVLDQAEGADQSAPQILQLRGRAMMALGRMDEAQQFFEAAGDYTRKELVALLAFRGHAELARRFLAEYDKAKLAGDTWPGSHVKMAEVAAVAGEHEQAVGYLAHAVSLGWRDIAWLKQSPFLADVLEVREGQAILERIERELALQRQLIEGML